MHFCLTIYVMIKKKFLVTVLLFSVTSTVFQLMIIIWTIFFEVKQVILVCQKKNGGPILITTICKVSRFLTNTKHCGMKHFIPDFVGQPSTSNRRDMWLLQSTGRIRRYFAIIEHPNMFVTSDSWSVFPLYTLKTKSIIWRRRRRRISYIYSKALWTASCLSC